MEDIPFWKELAAKQPGPLLELGCGTGRVLLQLASSGKMCYGVDHDPAMLSVLSQQLTPEVRFNARPIQADFTHLPLVGGFSSILMPCNTLSTLTPSEFNSVLAEVLSHLHPNGLFAASMPNPSVLVQMETQGKPELEETFPHPEYRATVHVFSSWKKAKSQFTVNWRYEYRLAGEELKQFNIASTHHIIPAKEYFLAFEKAGFHSVIAYGDYDSSPYSRYSDNLILVAFP
jgi:SAM-dependent methyltransferase